MIYLQSAIERIYECIECRRHNFALTVLQVTLSSSLYSKQLDDITVVQRNFMRIENDNESSKRFFSGTRQ